MAKLSRQAQKFISRKIRKNIHEGFSRRQAIALAFIQARKAGYHVPKKRRR